jgi:hypothetical protein
MFSGRKRDQAQVEAAAEHRKREDAAPRLRTSAPTLRTLRLTLDEMRPNGGSTATAYARPIVVANAPAHFEVRCMAPILRALSQRLTIYHGESQCNGVINDQMCDRTLKYSCEATYSS